jgi:hypothetical protein
MERSSQLHSPAALLSGKELPVPTEQEGGLDSEPIWMLWWREKYLRLSVVVVVVAVVLVVVILVM